MNFNRLPSLALLSLALAIPLTVSAQTPTVRYNFANNVLDQSGHGRDATLMGGASVDATQLTIGDNDVDYLAIPPAALDGLGDFTVMFTSKLDLRRTASGNQFHTVLSASTPLEEDNDNELLITCNPTFNQWRVWIDNSASAFAFSAGGNSTQSNVWHHVTLTRTGDQARLYMNGVQVGGGRTWRAAPHEFEPRGVK